MVIVPVKFPLTDPQAKLLLRRIHWPSGSFTQADGEKIYRLATEQKLEKRDASVLIDALKYMSTPNRTAEEEEAHEIGVREV